MSEQCTKNILADFMYKYGTITVCSGHGGMVHPWERNLLKHYINRQVVSIWVDPVDIHAYIKIK